MPSIIFSKAVQRTRLGLSAVPILAPGPDIPGFDIPDLGLAA